MLNRRQWLQQSGTGLLGATLLSPAHAARPVEPQVQRGHPPVLRHQWSFAPAPRGSRCAVISWLLLKRLDLLLPGGPP